MAFEVGAVVAKVKADITDFKKGMDNAKEEVNGFGKNLSSMASGIASFGKQAAMFTGVATAAVVAFGKASIDAYAEAETAQLQLAHAVKDVTHATNEEYIATNKLADALEAKGVLDGDNIKVGLAQLSTFGLSNKAVRGLGDSLADLAVNQFGVNASGEQLSQTANMIAKALNGQFGVLEKSGIRFNDAQRHMIEFGTEMEKVKAINEGFAQNLKFTNEVALQGWEGMMAKLRVQFGNFQEMIGGVITNLIPQLVTAFKTGEDSVGLFTEILTEFTGMDLNQAEAIAGILQKAVDAFRAMSAWINENQELVLGFLKGLAIAFGALVIIGTITALITALTNPITLVVLAIGALFAAWQTNFLGIQDITMFVVQVLQTIFDNVLKPIIQGVSAFVTEHWTMIKATTQFTFDLIVGIIKIAFNIISGVFLVMLKILTGDWAGAWEVIKQKAIAVWDNLKDIFNSAKNFIGAWANDVKERLTQPFEDAWNKIQETVRKIKDALDFTKRHSPSIMDIVNKSISLVNAAFEDFDFPNMPDTNRTAGAILAGAPAVGGGNISSQSVEIHVSLDGAIIGDIGEGSRIAESIGDSIIKRMQKQIRI